MYLAFLYLCYDIYVMVLLFFTGVPKDTGARIEKNIGQSPTVSSDTLKIG